MIYIEFSKFGYSFLTTGSDLCNKMDIKTYITGKNYNEDYNKKGE